MANNNATVSYFRLQAGKTRGQNIGPNFLKPIIAAPANGQAIIDVLSHRLFANTPNSNFKSRIPIAYVQEYELLTNSLVNQISYFSNFAKQGFNQDFQQRSTAAGEQNAGSSGYLESFFNGLVSMYQGIGSAGANIATRAVGAVTGRFGAVVNNSSQLQNSVLGEAFKPYNGLYQVKATGFNYIFPYFDDIQYNISNSFKDNFSGFLGTGDANNFKYMPNIFKAGGDLLKGVAESFLSVTPGAYNQPSTYIEVPQYYSAAEYETFSIKFNLLNTYDSSDFQRNYDLIFLLAFQNLPFREDIVKIQPPKLYSVYIPGQIYVPYSFIKSIKVSYVGNRRLMTLNKYTLPADGAPATSPQTCIIPDCYQVEIVFSSLIKPSSNQLLFPDINVSTGQTQISTAVINTPALENIVNDIKTSLIPNPSPAPGSTNIQQPTPTQNVYLGFGGGAPAGTGPALQISPNFF